MYFYNLYVYEPFYKILITFTRRKVFEETKPENPVVYGNRFNI